MSKETLLLYLTSLIGLVYFFISTPCIAQTAGPIVVSKMSIDDDVDTWADDHSEGDDDGIAEQGEKIRMDIFLKNQGTEIVTNVQATISTESNWVAITNATGTYEDINGGEEKSSAGIWRDGFHFTVAQNAPSLDVLFTVKINTDNSGSYTDSVVVSIKGGGTPGPISVSDFTIDDDEDSWASDNSEGDNDNIPEQGETIRLPVTLLNSGSSPAFDVKVTLRTTSPNIVLLDSTSDYAVLGDNDPESNAGMWRDGFHFKVKSDAESEDLLFVLNITTRHAGTFTDSITILINGNGTPGPTKVESFSIDDDDDSWASDKSQGDGDGIAEQSEKIRMPITIFNEGSAPLFDVKATLSTASNNVTITEASADYNVLGDGKSEDNEGMWRDGFHFKVLPDAQSEDVVFVLEITTRNSGTFVDSFTVSIVGGGIVGPVEISSFQIDDDNSRWADDHSSGNGDGIINENETIRLAVTLANRGTATALEVTGALSTAEPLITITEATKPFGSIGGGEEANNVGIWRDGFHFTVASSIPNKNVRFDLSVSTGNGINFTDSLIIAIGTETDQSPPIISILSPLESKPVPVRRFPIEIKFHDGLYGSGIDSTTFRLTNDKNIGSNGTSYVAGTDLSDFFAIFDTTVTFVVPDSLEFPLGENTLTATISDKVGNSGEARLTFNTSYFGLLNAADGAYVNVSPFPLNGYAVEKYVGSIEVDGASVSPSNDKFSFDVQLASGMNVVEVTAYDHAMTLIGTQQFTLFYDNIPPSLAIISPLNGAVSQYSPISVSGTASDESPFEVFLNAKPVEVTSGQFSEEIEIGEGEYGIKARAVDAAGNENEVTITITGEPPASPEGKLKLFLKDKVLSQFPYAPYPPNTSGYHMSYVFGTSSWQTVLPGDINGTEYKVSLLAGCYGLGSAQMQAEIVVRQAAEETVIATSEEFVGYTAGPTPWGFSSPSREELTFSGIDPQTQTGDTLILRVRKVGGDRAGLIFIRVNNSFSWITIPNEKSTAVEYVQISQVPNEFDLNQNYPNPFNPETTIKYQIPKASEVKLEIYNIIGQRVVSLVDRQQSADFYSIKWEGKDGAGRSVASGVYVYVLRAGDFTQARKMILTR